PGQFILTTCSNEYPKTPVDEQHGFVVVMTTHGIQPHLDIVPPPIFGLPLAYQVLYAFGESRTCLCQHSAIGLALVHPAFYLGRLRFCDDGKTVHRLRLLNRRSQMQYAIANQWHDHHEE